MTIARRLLAALLLIAAIRNPQSAIGGTALVTLLDMQSNVVASAKCVVTAFSLPASQNGGVQAQWRTSFTSDSNGQFSITNAAAGKYLVTPTDPNLRTFQFYMPSTNGSVNAADYITADAGNSVPPDTMSYGVNASDRRYMLRTEFNSSNGVTTAVTNQLWTYVTNADGQLVSKTALVSSNFATLTQATNAARGEAAAQLLASNLVSRAQLVSSNYVTASVTNGLVSSAGLASSNYVTTTATNGLVTVTQLQSSNFVPAVTATNIARTEARSEAAAQLLASNLVSRAQLASSNYVTASVTNGLVSSAGLASSNYVTTTATNGLVTVTQLQSSNFVPAVTATNIARTEARSEAAAQLLASNLVSRAQLVSSNYVTASVTNGLVSGAGLSSSNYVTATVTNGLVALTQLQSSNFVPAVTATNISRTEARSEAAAQLLASNLVSRAQLVSSNYVTASVTNGLVSGTGLSASNYVNRAELLATNAALVAADTLASNVLQTQITSISGNTNLSFVRTNDSRDLDLRGDVSAAAHIIRGYINDKDVLARVETGGSISDSEIELTNVATLINLVSASNSLVTRLVATNTAIAAAYAAADTVTSNGILAKAMTNGQVNLSVQSFLLGANTNVYATTNVVGAFKAGTAAAQGTYRLVSSTLYTNLLTGAWITNNGTTWNCYSAAGTALYTSAGLTNATWTIVGGSSPALYTVYGEYVVGQGLLWLGELASTNLEARLTVLTNAIALKLDRTNGTSYNQVLNNATAQTLGSSVLRLTNSDEYGQGMNIEITQQEPPTAGYPAPAASLALDGPTGLWVKTNAADSSAWGRVTYTTELVGATNDLRPAITNIARTEARSEAAAQLLASNLVSRAQLASSNYVTATVTNGLVSSAGLAASNYIASLTVSGGSVTYVTNGGKQTVAITVTNGGGGGGGAYPTNNLTMVVGTQTPFQVNSNSEEIVAESTNLPVRVRGVGFLKLHTTAGGGVEAHEMELRQGTDAQAGGGSSLNFHTPAYGTDGSMSIQMDNCPWMSSAFSAVNNSCGLAFSCPQQLNKGSSWQTYLVGRSDSTNGYSRGAGLWISSLHRMTQDGDAGMTPLIAAYSSSVYLTGTDDGTFVVQDPHNQLPVEAVSHSVRDGSVHWTVFSQRPSGAWDHGPTYSSWDGSVGNTLSSRNKSMEYLFNDGITNFIITAYQTNAGDTVTFTTDRGHNLNVGNTVVVYELKNTTEWAVGDYFNNTYTVNAKTANSFTVDATVDADAIPATLTNLNGYCYNASIPAVITEKLSLYGISNTVVATVTNNEFVIGTTLKNVGTVASASIGYPNSFAVGSPVERAIALSGVLTSAPPNRVICTPFTNIDAQVLFHAVVRSNNYVNVIFNTTATVTTGKTNTFYVTWIQ